MPQRHTAGLFCQRKREAEEVYDRMYFVSYVRRLSLAEAYAAVLSRDGTLPFSLPQHRRAKKAATEATHPLSQDGSSANSCNKTLTLTEIVSAKWLNSLLNQHYIDIHKAFKCKCIWWLGKMTNTFLTEDGSLWNWIFSQRDLSNLKE